MTHAMISQIAESNIKTYIITAPTGSPAPKIAVTRFQLKIPTNPQFMAPIMTKIEAIIFAIIIFSPPTLIFCARFVKLLNLIFDLKIANILHFLVKKSKKSPTNDDF